jgi:hypothetical protein
MSDCFDHFNDAMDSYDRAIDEGFAHGRRSAQQREWLPLKDWLKAMGIPAHRVTCRNCGARGLKWKETESGWRLFSKARGADGKKLLHTCSALADFDDIS